MKTKKLQFAVGNIIDDGYKKMTIINIEKQSIYFQDETGQGYQGFSASTLRKLVEGGAWKIINK